MTALLSLATRLALWLLLLAVVGALAVVVVLPRAVDGAALTVLTGSMSPSIPAGSVVVVQPVDPRTLRVGDVVTYQERPGRSAFVTHRITAIDETADPVSLTTKGDANRGADSRPVPVTSVRGRVLLAVPHLGAVRNAVGLRGSGPLVLVVLLAGYAVAQSSSALRDRQRSRATSTTTGTGAAALRLQTLVVTLRTAEFGGLSPASVASLLRMDLLVDGPSSFTVAVVREPGQVDELVELLSPFCPTSVVRSEVVQTPVEPPPPAADPQHSPTSGACLVDA